MEIDFLSNLSNQPPNENNYAIIRGISLNQIEELEELYNNGKLFPKALRELLFLAGDFCYALNRIWYKNQQEIQTASKEWLLEYNVIIEKPFFVIAAYSIGESFSFVYLDEGNDPIVHQTYLSNNTKMVLRNLNKTLSTYVNSCIDLTKEIPLQIKKEFPVLF